MISQRNSWIADWQVLIIRQHLARCEISEAVKYLASIYKTEVPARKLAEYYIESVISDLSVLPLGSF